MSDQSISMRSGLGAFAPCGISVFYLSLAIASTPQAAAARSVIDIRADRKASKPTVIVRGVPERGYVQTIHARRKKAGAPFAERRGSIPRRTAKSLFRTLVPAERTMRT